MIRTPGVGLSRIASLQNQYTIWIFDLISKTTLALSLHEQFGPTSGQKYQALLPLIFKLLLYDKANPWKSNIECYLFSIALMLQTKYHLSLWGSLASHSKCWSEQTHSELQCHTCTGTVKCHQVLDPPSLEESRHELQRISWDKNKSKIMVSCLTIVFCQQTVFYFNKTK